MGPKKKKGAPGKPESLFKFDINNFCVDLVERNVLKIIPKVPEIFHEVSFKIRIKKNPLNGQCKFDVDYYKCLQEEPVVLKPGQKPSNENKVFVMIDPVTGREFIIDPKKTNGKQPYIAYDPVNDKDIVIGDNFMIHLDPSTGTRYLLDMDKFENGKFEFKDPNTNKSMEADLTKRFDPATGEPLTDDNFNFVSAIKDGKMYIIQNKDTGEIVICDAFGNPIDAAKEGFHKVYDPESNITTLLDEKDEPIYSFEGEVQIRGIDLENLTLEQRGYNLLNKKFNLIKESSTGAVKILNDKKEPIIPRNNYVYIVEDPVTKNLILVDPYGHSVPGVPKDFTITKDSTTGKIILVDSEGRSLEKVLANKIINEEEPDTTKNNISGQDEATSLRLIRDPITGSLVFVDKNKTVVPMNKIYEVTDPITGIKMFYNEEGNPIDKSELCKSTPAGGDTSPQKHASKDPNLAPHEKKSDLEKYFEDMNCPEANNVLEQLKSLGHFAPPIFLRMLRDFIELNKELTRCILQEALKVQKDYIGVLMEEKEARQNIFINDLEQSLSEGAYMYDHTDLVDKILRKLHRENVLLVDKLETRMLKENKLIRDTLAENIKASSQKIVRFINVPCFNSCKRIIFKDLVLNLDKQIADIKKQLAERMSKEREQFIERFREI